MSLFHKNKPQDTFNWIGAYLTTLVKQIQSQSLERRRVTEKGIRPHKMYSLLAWGYIPSFV